MVSLTALWLPILLSAVVVHFAAAIVWMVLPHHKTDWGKIPDEGKILDHLKDHAVGPGMYHLPFHGGGSEMKNPAYQETLRSGQAIFMQVWPGTRILNMGKSMMMVFIYYIVIGILVAYLGSRVLPVGTEYMTVFQVIGVAALLGYAGSLPLKAIFWGYSWSMVLKEMFDAALYALLTAGVFGWLWPG